MKLNSFILGILVFTASARAADFASQVDLTPVRLIAVQHNQTMKTMDTFAREAIKAITGQSRLDGNDPVFTLLDMSFRPSAYVDRNMIRIANVPLRQEFQKLDAIDAAEKDRIVKEGTVSLHFLQRDDVRSLMGQAQQTSVFKSKAIDQLMDAVVAMQVICESNAGMIPAGMIPPGPGAGGDGLWHSPWDFVKPPQEGLVLLEGYEGQDALLLDIVRADAKMYMAWGKGDAAGVNQAAGELAEFLPNVNPAAYPSLLKRRVEVIYNRVLMLTLPGAAFYFVAFVLFLVAARAGVARTRLWGLRFMAAAFLIHTLGICVRWWLVGSVFPPIKNEFESVMFSAWFGALVGLGLELKFARGFFGAAASFVGTLALVAIFAAPYVSGREIGGEIAPVQGVLMSYWLYIHVTMVTSAYALISMGFVLSAWWLIRYYFTYGTLRRAPRERRGFDVVESSGGSGGSALSVSQTLLQMLFVPVARDETRTEKLAIPVAQRDFLVTLDQANIVVLQLAFWVLGTGIVLGAIWADQSWGRPWGWDPKETFALVTWIVYLIVVHVRVAAQDKGWWTAVLGCIGFFIMLFNWIGVNFFLVGLHSYA